MTVRSKAFRVIFLAGLSGEPFGRDKSSTEGTQTKTKPIGTFSYIGGGNFSSSKTNDEIACLNFVTTWS